MTPEQLAELKVLLQDTVKTTVNGKIDRLHKILETQNETMQEFHSKVENYIEEDVDWKKNYEPYLLGMKSLTISGKIVLWIIGAIGTVIGVILAYRNL